MLKKIYRLYRTSFLLMQLSIVILSIVIFISFKKVSGPSYLGILLKNYDEILNGIGILSSFYILVIDKIELSTLKYKFPKKVNVFGESKSIAIGVKLMNTIFSMIITTFLLLGFCYTSLLLDKRYPLVLIILVINLFSSFISAIGIWHFSELNE